MFKAKNIKEITLFRIQKKKHSGRKCVSNRRIDILKNEQYLTNIEFDKFRNILNLCSETVKVAVMNERESNSLVTKAYGNSTNYDRLQRAVYRNRVIR